MLYFHLGPIQISHGTVCLHNIWVCINCTVPYSTAQPCRHEHTTEPTQVSTNVRIHVIYTGLCGTIQIRMDYCGQLWQKYATVRTIQGMLDFCGLQFVESCAATHSVNVAIFYVLDTHGTIWFCTTIMYCLNGPFAILAFMSNRNAVSQLLLHWLTVWHSNISPLVYHGHMVLKVCEVPTWCKMWFGVWSLKIWVPCILLVCCCCGQAEPELLKTSEQCWWHFVQLIMLCENVKLALDLWNWILLSRSPVNCATADHIKLFFFRIWVALSYG